MNAITGRRYELVKDAAHALKGGAASVGATQLVQFAKRIEKASHDSLRLKAAQWIEELKLLHRQARAALSAQSTPTETEQLQSAAPSADNPDIADRTCDDVIGLIM